MLFEITNTIKCFISPKTIETIENKKRQNWRMPIAYLVDEWVTEVYLQVHKIERFYLNRVYFTFFETKKYFSLVFIYSFVLNNACAMLNYLFPILIEFESQKTRKKVKNKKFVSVTIHFILKREKAKMNATH